MREAAAGEGVERGLDVARVPDAEEDARSERSFPVIVRANCACHEREYLRERVRGLDIDMQLRVAVLRLARDVSGMRGWRGGMGRTDPHKELDRFVEGGNGLLRLLLGPELLHPVGAVPLMLFDSAYGTRVRACY